MDSHGNDAYWYVLRTFPLPHEPKSAYRYAFNLIGLGSSHLAGSVGNFAECKHCGAIYAKSEGQ
jgi:hypothetical protein